MSGFICRPGLIFSARHDDAKLLKAVLIEVLSTSYPHPVRQAPLNAFVHLSHKLSMVPFSINHKYLH